MVIEPKIRGFICTTSHPKGCEKYLKDQVAYVKKKGMKGKGPKKVLVIGASQGFGLASRISAAFGFGADTLGVFFERPSMKGRPASAGWYLTAAFDKEAEKEGLYAKSFNGDAFSDSIKQKVIETIKKDFGKIDLLVYSLAAPRRTDPKTGETYTSTLKTIGEPYVGKTIDTNTRQISEIKVEPATDKDIENTVKVMGGEDWQMWIDALKENGLLADGFKTVAYSYIGPSMTFPIYREGTIGRAKLDLEKTAHTLSDKLKDINGHAYISVNKALVTQASSAIPIVPLYIGILYKVMKEKGLHEGPIEQMHRLFDENLYKPDGTIPVDNEGRIRMDNLEMRDDVQAEVEEIWNKINNDNVDKVADFDGYRQEFLRLFGFGMEGVDYSADLDPDVKIQGLIE